MVAPLVVLAILATVGGFVGISTALTGGREVGGRLNIVTWMSPIIWNPASKSFGAGESRPEVVRGKPVNTPVNEAAHPYGESGFNLAEAAAGKVGGERWAEMLFMGISLLVAGLGMGLGYLFYVKDTRLPDAWAARLGPLYCASYHKYWIDEFYGWAITRRTMDLARGVFAFDSKVVDGGVNASAWLTRLSSVITGGADKYFVDGLVNAIAGFIIQLMSPIVRAAQTGFIQNYALVMVIGLLAAVALFFGKDFGKDIVAAVKDMFAFML